MGNGEMRKRRGRGIIITPNSVLTPNSALAQRFATANSTPNALFAYSPSPHSPLPTPHSNKKP
ncbi:hypothetical protein H1Q63_14890 [Desmonostoc muscorum CCALA 125]|nr:hypothetical protein [Desmonostoc muscorum CCALA 125]